MIILPDVKLNYDDVLIVPQRSSLDSRADVSLERTFKFPHYAREITCVPIIASNMYNTGTIAMATSLSKHKMLTALHKYYLYAVLLDRLDQPSLSDYFFVTIGESNDDLEELKGLFREGTYTNFMVCVDVANGYRASFVDFIKRVRNEFCEEVLIMAGNVTTPEMTQELILAGADIVKVGIGPGSVCETRKVTGVGYPMLSAIIECTNAAHGLNGHIVADGGCRTPGDIAKAFCAGADFVMLGGMLAGVDENEGEWVEHTEWINHYSDSMFISSRAYQTVKQLKFFGMSSHEAMAQFGGAEKEYRASEGVSTLVTYKGPVDNVVREILGGLRSCGSYIGCDKIKHFPRAAVFAKTSGV